jgi:trehalose synthase-fused probable maltokinase
MTGPSIGNTEALPSLAAKETWPGLLLGDHKQSVERILPDFLCRCRWFAGKARELTRVSLSETLALSDAPDGATLNVVEVHYSDGGREIYFLPLALLRPPDAPAFLKTVPGAALAWVTSPEFGNAPGLLVDASYVTAFQRELLTLFEHQTTVRGMVGQVQASTLPAFGFLRGTDPIHFQSRTLGAEQSNTSVVYGDRLMLKLFRRLDEGPNPEAEMAQYLAGQEFGRIPALAGLLEYRRLPDLVMTLACLQAYVANDGDAWSLALGEAKDFYARVLPLPAPHYPAAGERLTDHLEHESPATIQRLVGPFLEKVRLIGRRCAELHLALSAGNETPDFAPEPFSGEAQRESIEGMIALAERNFRLLRSGLARIPTRLQDRVRAVLGKEKAVIEHFKSLQGTRFSTTRQRCHGDFHLGQVLYASGDFCFIDFEGEPSRPLAQRRAKEPVLRDVAGMLRSFHYAALGALADHPGDDESKASLIAWALAWQTCVSKAFVCAYLESASGAILPPESGVEWRALLDAFLLEKAVYELGYELNSRPDWLGIPVDGILQIIGD